MGKEAEKKNSEAYKQRTLGGFFTALLGYFRRQDERLCTTGTRFSLVKACEQGYKDAGGERETKGKK